MNLILCGMMGSGKTTVGKALARLTERRFADTDAMIVEKYGEIPDIFARYGEARFREMETEIAETVEREKELVLATGGGFVLTPKNVELVKRGGKLVFLRATVDTLERRLFADKERPLLQGETETLREKLERLLKARAAVYEAVADVIVDVDGKSVETVVKEIAERTNE